MVYEAAKEGGQEEQEMSLSGLSRDPRIILFALVLSASLIGLIPMPTEHGLDSRLKYGLDLEGGSWLQLQLQGAVVDLDCDPIEILRMQFGSLGLIDELSARSGTYQINMAGKISKDDVEEIGYAGARVIERTNQTRITLSVSPEYVILAYLKSALDADVKTVGVEPVRYEIRSNVTRESLNAILAPINGSVAAGEEAFTEGVTIETVDETKKVLDQKLNRLGLQDIRVRVVGNRFILIDLAGVDVDTAQDVVGKPGKFEIRIQTKGNESMHVLYGDAVQAVEHPKSGGGGRVGVPFTLSEDGAQLFQRAAIDSGATRNPQAHYVTMLLDKDEIFSAPLATDLAGSLEKAPMRNLEATVGTGDEGWTKGGELYIHLREGALPVNVEIIGSGQVTAALGAQFKRQITIAGIIALLIVALIVYYRYREKRIVIPMVGTSLSEVFIMLGIWSWAGWQLDLASIAGIITVIGTGVDHLFIITDELLRGEAEAPKPQPSKNLKPSQKNIQAKAEQLAQEGGKISIPGGKVYVARLSRAFAIILGAALTTVFAMAPLVWMGFGALQGFALIIIIGVLIGVGVARPAYGKILGYILSENGRNA